MRKITQYGSIALSLGLFALASAVCFNPKGAPEGSTSDTDSEGAEAGTGSGEGPKSDMAGSASTPTAGPESSESSPPVPTTGHDVGSTVGANASASSDDSSTGAGVDTASTSSEGGESTSEGPDCGDALVDREAGEECDDGQVSRGLDGCDDTCHRDALFVFVSSQVFVGDGFGQAAADAECELLAASVQAKGFPDATFVAWMSDSMTQPAKDHILLNGDDSLPYLRTDFVPVAADAATFWSGALLNPILANEAGALIDLNGNPSACEDPMTAVWTWTAADGTGALGCEGGATKGTIGSLNDADALWTQSCLYDCGLSASIYCVELAPAP